MTLLEKNIKTMDWRDKAIELIKNPKLDSAKLHSFRHEDSRTQLIHKSRSIHIKLQTSSMAAIREEFRDVIGSATLKVWAEVLHKQKNIKKYFAPSFQSLDNISHDLFQHTMSSGSGLQTQLASESLISNQVHIDTAGWTPPLKRNLILHSLEVQWQCEFE